MLLKFDSCQRSKWFDKGVSLTTEKYKDSLFTWKDKYAKEHYQNTLIVVSSKEAQELFKTEIAQKTKELKIAKQAILSSTGVKTSVTIRPSDIIYKTDTIPCKDSFVLVQRIDTLAPMIITDSLGITQYLKPNGWFRNPTPTIDVVSYYGRTNVTHLKGYVIKDTYSKWSIGIGLGYALPVGSLQVSAGVFYKLFTIGGKK